MIPYSLLMIKIKWNDSHELEVRALDLWANGFSFRVDEPRRADFEIKPALICCNFLNYRQGLYEKAEFSDFELREIKNSGYAACGAAVYEAVTEDETFAGLSAALSKEYLNYIRIRQNCGEQEILEQMTGQKMENDFSDSIGSWREKKTAENISWEGELLGCELAAVADSPEMTEKFLEMSKADFAAAYWRANALENHPISRQDITHVYIGSQFCPFKIPDSRTLGKIYEKAGKAAVLCLPPMTFSMTERFRKIVSGLEDGVEVVVNDIGALLMIKESGKHLKITAGVLLNKRKKDPRTEYAFGSRTSAYSSIDSQVYEEYLRSMGVSMISYEAGTEFKVSQLGGAMHLPLYQTNTSTFCTLKAAVEKGSRGLQLPSDSCQYHCSDHSFLYPDGSNIVGIGNSLFGCSMRELNDVKLLNGLIKHGVRRLVVRL